ncbi:hypothetical protein DPEC_G00051450 [Dallia pectoralis]|uniref:Uncharacterized protein n=1 Tax=Dallia pectoralis TaxID=75939 RepID=A0ACC2HBD0_DALPE|nr:hypothetical protein DPEC_G00051450 [Dallia pectoralis]
MIHKGTRGGLLDTLDFTVQSVCLQQPIGKHLFREFLEARPEYHGPCHLEFEFAKDSDRAQTMTQIGQRYLQSLAKLYCSFITPKMVNQVKESKKGVFALIHA